MEELLNTWAVVIQQRFDTEISTSSAQSSQHSNNSERSNSRHTSSVVDVAYILSWYQREVMILLYTQVGAQFWKHYDWFTLEAIDDDGFIENIQNTLRISNAELLQAKKVILEQLEAIFDSPLFQTAFSTMDAQRCFVRALHHFETFWHLIVHPPATMLIDSKLGQEARKGLWKKLVFHILNHYFELLRSDKNQEEDEEEPKAEDVSIETFNRIVTQINLLGLTETCSEVLQALLLEKLESRVNEKHGGIFDQADQLDEAKQWVAKDCLSFLARVLVPTQSLDHLSDNLDKIEHGVHNQRFSLRESQDSDLDDHFELLHGLKRITPNQQYLPHLGYPYKDPTSSIKRPYGRSLQTATLGHSDDSDPDSDSDEFVPSQPIFGTKTPSRHLTHTHSNDSRSMSTPQSFYANDSSLPSSPQQKAPASPIPMSMSMMTIQDLMSRESVHAESEAKQLFKQMEICEWRKYLFSSLIHSFVKLRISEMFNMIVDYPDSMPALKDLKTCLDKTQQYAEFVASLRAAFQKRLLHPGATTADIVATYISAIRAIREIDPSNVLLNHVTVELRHYLRLRPDSLRCIVSLLTEDGGESGVSLISELEEETSSNSTQLSRLGQEYADVDSDDDGDYTPLLQTSTTTTHKPIAERNSLWTPAPIIHAPASSTSGTSYGGALGTSSANPSAADHSAFGSRSKDMISALISIHGSKEHFVAEYANLMAARLLELSDFATENEVKNVELLKIKFGDSAMLQCEVMLKDMAESKRSNAHISRTLKEKLSHSPPSSLTSPLNANTQIGIDADSKESKFSSAIFSHLFWPSNFQPLAVALPQKIQENRDAFAKEFTALKDNRSLQWYDTMGVVDLELTFFGGTDNDTGDNNDNIDKNYENENGNNEMVSPKVVEFRVTPLQAAVVLHCQEKDEISLDELGKMMKVSPENVKKGLSLWISNGVIRETAPNMYQLSDSIDSSEQVDEVDANVEEAGEGAASNDYNEFAPYVVAMLKNLGALHLARIHQMMKNVSEDYEMTIQQLSELLGRLVTEEKLELKNGQYSLKK